MPTDIQQMQSAMQAIENTQELTHDMRAYLNLAARQRVPSARMVPAFIHQFKLKPKAAGILIGKWVLEKAEQSGLGKLARDDETLPLPKSVGIEVADELIANRAKIERLTEINNDLVAALKRATDHLLMSGTRCDDAPEALAQARAALAKARS